MDVNDSFILNWLKNNGLIPEDNPGQGDCLFYSLEGQISKKEFIDLQIMAQLAESSRPVDVLRKVAILHEEDFLNGDTFNQSKEDFLNGDTFNQSKEDWQWIYEMAKDWYEELFGLLAANKWVKHDKNSQLVILGNRQEYWKRTSRLKFVLGNRQEYWKRTSRRNNWAGSSEAIAIARVLGRNLKIYGNDRVSESIVWDGEKIIPLLEYKSIPVGTPAKPDILIWQANGGGHYMMLKRL